MTTAVPPPPRPRRLRQLSQVGAVVLALLWWVLADTVSGWAARGIADRFDAETARPLLAAGFLVFLLMVGFALLETLSGGGSVSLRRALGLPRRPTAGREWRLGAAIGWGVALLAVLPMALGRSLHVRFWTEARSWEMLALNAGALALGTLATEMALRGFPLRRLVSTLGPWRGTALLVGLVGLRRYFSPDGGTAAVLVAMTLAVVLSLGWLRTHGLWLPWGVHFAWSAAVALVFGLPLRGANGFGTVVQTRAIGADWLTGNEFGPEAAGLTVVVLLATIVVLVLATRDFAWEYTRPEIVAAGYPVEPGLPAAHVAMEQEAAVKAPALVQILPVTPGSHSLGGE